MRYKITAWGSANLPDLDYETDEVPPDLYQNYAFIEVVLLTPIYASDIRAALAERLKHNQEIA